MWSIVDIEILITAAVSPITLYHTTSKWGKHLVYSLQPGWEQFLVLTSCSSLRVAWVQNQFKSLTCYDTSPTSPYSFFFFFLSKTSNGSQLITTTLSLHMSASRCFLVSPRRCSFFFTPRLASLTAQTLQVTRPSERVMGKDEVKLPDPDMHKPTSFDLLSFLLWPLAVGIHLVLNWLNQNRNIQCGGLPVLGLTESLSTEPRG